MNICVLTTTYPRYPGDPTGSFIAGQARALAEAGHRVVVVAPHDSTARSQDVEGPDHLRVYRFNYWLPHRWQRLCYGAGIPENFRRNHLVILQVPTLLLAFVLRALPLARHCEVVHGHWSFAGLSAVVVGRLVSKPVVITMHGAEALSGLMRPINRLLGRWADQLIVNSTFTRTTIRRYMPLVEPVVIPFGVNREKIAPAGFVRAAFRERVGLGPNTFAILAVGRLVERKGFHILLEAAAKLSPAMDWCILIGGTGPERDALQTRIDGLCLGDRVRLLGFIDDDELAQWYTACDVFVLPAVVDSSGDTEGLGVVLLEAMANGTPVVASRTGGIVDTVRDRETGLLCEPGDPSSLATQLLQLLNDPSLRESLSKGAYHRIEDEFSWEVLTGRLLDVYQGTPNHY
jgi:glycosyltransferase involved in cell wall biosynthesis